MRSRGCLNRDLKLLTINCAALCSGIMLTSVIHMRPFIKLPLIRDCVKAGALDVSEAGLVHWAGVMVTGSISAALSETVFTAILGSKKKSMKHSKCH